MVPGGRVRVDAGRQPLDLRVRERVALSGRRRGLLLSCCASSPLLLSSCFVLGGAASPFPPPCRPRLKIWNTLRQDTHT